MARYIRYLPRTKRRSQMTQPTPENNVIAHAFAAALAQRQGTTPRRPRDAKDFQALGSEVLKIIVQEQA